jgi:hypothetical protein
LEAKARETVDQTVGKRVSGSLHPETRTCDGAIGSIRFGRSSN